MLMNYILIGFMGCGKSSIGRFMSQKGYKLIDTDSYIEEKEHRSVRSIFDTDGEEYFRNLETAAIAELAERNEDGYVIAVGGGLPMREENRRYMHEIGTVVYLRATVDTLENRLKGDESRPLLKGGNIRDRIQKLMLERAYTYEKTADIAVDTDGRSYEDVYKLIKENTPK